MKTIKIIDLFKKIANGEIPTIIIFDTEKYKYISGHYVREYDGIHIDLNEDYNLYRCLNDEVEILDEEDEFEDFEDIKRFGIHYSLDYIDYRNIEVLKEYLNKDFQNIFDTLDLLIKNQKKIIEWINNEKKKD